MTVLGVMVAAGLSIGLVLGRLSARARRRRLEHEARGAAADLERIARIAAVLRAYPFGDGVRAVLDARTDAGILKRAAQARLASLRRSIEGGGA